MTDSMTEDEKDLHGADVLASLAKIYQQLYIAPGEGAQEKYHDIVQKGRDAKEHDLSHFITSDKDSLIHEETPAGKVAVITLGRREDFITFLRIMGNRCEMVDIPNTQGASVIDGIIDWRKIWNHMAEYALSDWNEEFMRFTSDRNNFKVALIILSIGPYSAVPAEKLGLSDDEWISLSGKIRKYHECTHFICRKLYPDKKDAVWDELVADTVGIYAAFGRFDPDMAKMFLGIDGNTYTGGRLENYIDVDTAVVENICKVFDYFSKIVSEQGIQSPFELAIKLEDTKDELWK